MCFGDVATSAPSSKDLDALIAELQAKHRMDVENLTLTRQPFKTSKIFIVAIMQYLKQSFLHVLTNGVWIMFLSILSAVFGLLLIIVDGQHVHEVLRYFRFGLWWVALGVASSIGLGSGLHTFVLYLGPHIALFTIKAMKCGRVDLKSAPYDTIQLKRGASWLQRDCFEFGPPLYPLLPDSLVRVPISSILPQVQPEVILWGLGTALGELPPYFISRTARWSGSELDAMEEVDVSSSKEDGFVSATLKHIKRRFLSRLQHLNFFTILLLASVPNPLFDLAGIMCGQFGIPFWKFFLATLTGKAIIKTHIQTVFIISLCNNQLLEVLENEFIFAHQLIPGFSSMLTSTIAKLSMVQQKYLSAPVSIPSPLDEKTKQWNLSFALIWNTLIWFVLVNNFVKIVTHTAQGYLKKQHDLELMEKVSGSKHSNS